MTALVINATEVVAETERAMGLHDPMHSTHEAYAVIKEELDEFWEQVKINPNKLLPGEREQRLTKMHNELIQIAAMCMRAMVDLGL